MFSWPGVGRLIVQSVSKRDEPVISLIFVVVNLIVDILYGVLDSRVRLS